MPNFSRVKAGASACAILMCLVAGSAPGRAAKSVSKVTIGNSVAVLSGGWKFHPGDDPAWAQPDFDDTNWGTIDLTPPPGSVDPILGETGYVPGWTAQGYPHLTGFAWYRLRLNVANESGERLALRMPINFDDSYQVYANGQLIGEFGRFVRGHTTYFNAQPRAFVLPESMRSGPITIAVRMWMAAGTIFLSQDAGGLHGSPMLGQDDSIGAMLRLGWDSVNRTELANVMSAALSLLVAVLGLTLFWLDRREKAYVFLALACMAAFAERATVITGYYTMSLSMVSETILQSVVLTPLILALWALFWAYWFRIERIDRIVRVTALLLFAQCAGTAALSPSIYGDLVPVRASHWLEPTNLILKLALGAVLLWVCFRGIRKHASGAWLTIVPVLLTVEWQYNYELEVIHVGQLVHVGGVVLNTGQISNIVMLAIVSILLMQRFVRGQRQQELLRVEIEQARQVQQVLIPEALPRIPGFALASEYRPAQQVGGDFFQIVPLHDGGVLAVVGDVSGKGMPAAMTVSLLVGTLRTLIQFTTSPGEILAEMNVRMLARMQGGFTTCMVAHVHPHGDLVIANAGHLDPYIDGTELQTEAGLPLGLSAETRYPETNFTLGVGKQLTMLTDGVVESRNASGELLGFERTAAMAGEAAESIAKKAQEFGQGDDITVLTLKRLATGEEPAMRVASSVIVADVA